MGAAARMGAATEPSPPLPGAPVWRDDIPTMRRMDSLQPVCHRHRDRITYLRCSRCDRHICPDCSIDSAVGQRCPDCSPVPPRRPAPRPARASRTRMMGGSVTPAVLTIIIVTVVAYILQRIFPDFVINNFAHATWLVAAGEWWRGITAAFLHSQSFFLHIAFNMYFLYILGPRLEQQVGSASFVVLYLGSAAGGGVAFQYLVGGPAVALGASGAVFGLLGAALAGAYRVRSTPAGMALFRQLMFVLAINLALPFFVGNVAWQAHLGGLAAGLVIAALWQRIRPGPKLNSSRTLAALAVTVVALALLWAA